MMSVSAIVKWSPSDTCQTEPWADLWRTNCVSPISGQFGTHEKIYSLSPKSCHFFRHLHDLPISTQKCKDTWTQVIPMSKYCITQISLELRNWRHGYNWMKRLSSFLVLCCTTLTRESLNAPDTSLDPPLTPYMSVVRCRRSRRMHRRTEVYCVGVGFRSTYVPEGDLLTLLCDIMGEGTCRGCYVMGRLQGRRGEKGWKFYWVWMD